MGLAAAVDVFLGGIANGWYGLIWGVMIFRMRCWMTGFDYVVVERIGWAQDDLKGRAREGSGVPPDFIFPDSGV